MKILSEFGKLWVMRKPVEVYWDKVEENKTYLGGYFDVGGTISVSHRPQRGTKYHIGFSDLTERAESFRLAIGGSTYSRTIVSSDWVLEGTKAVAFAGVIAPFSPSRQAVAALFIEVSSARSDAERVELINHANAIGLNQISCTDPNFYTDLIKNPKYLAGVFDSRAVVGCDGQKYVHITTPNLVLMECLKKEYGGSIALRQHSGQEKDIMGKIRILKRDSTRWRISSGVAIDFLKLIKENVRLRSRELETFVSPK